MKEAKIKTKIPVVLTREEVEKLKEQPRLEEKHYRKELRKKKSQGSR